MDTTLENKSLRKPLCAAIAFIAAAVWFYFNNENWGIPAATIFATVITVFGSGILMALTEDISVKNFQKPKLSVWLNAPFNRWDFILPIGALGISLSALLAVNYLQLTGALTVIACILFAVSLSPDVKRGCKFIMYAAIYCAAVSMWMLISHFLLLPAGGVGVVAALVFPSWFLMLVSFVSLSWNGQLSRALASVGLNVMVTILFQVPILAALWFLLM